MLSCCNTLSAWCDVGKGRQVGCQPWVYRSSSAQKRALLRSPDISPSPSYREGRRALAQADFFLWGWMGMYLFSSSFWVKHCFLTAFEVRYNTLSLCELAGERWHPMLLKFANGSSVHLLSSSFSLTLKSHCSGQEWHLCLKAKAYGKDSLGIWCFSDTDSSAEGSTGLLRQSVSLVPFA